MQCLDTCHCLVMHQEAVERRCRSEGGATNVHLQQKKCWGENYKKYTFLKQSKSIVAATSALCLLMNALAFLVLKSVAL